MTPEVSPTSARGRLLEEAGGEDFLRAFLADIEEEDRLSAALGVDVSEADPLPEQAPRTYGTLRSWLERSLEVHRFIEAARRASR